MGQAITVINMKTFLFSLVLAALVTVVPASLLGREEEKVVSALRRGRSLAAAAAPERELGHHSWSSGSSKSGKSYDSYYSGSKSGKSYDYYHSGSKSGKSYDFYYSHSGSKSSKSYDYYSGSKSSKSHDSSHDSWHSWDSHRRTRLACAPQILCSY